MTSRLIAFIGGGNMATSLVGGLLADAAGGWRTRVAEPDASRREALAARFGISTCADNAEAAQGADAVVLAVKPYVVRSVAETLAETLADRPLLISIAAGVRTDTILRWLSDPDWPLVRAMPNTPALIRCGMSGLFATPAVSAPQRTLAQSILQAVGDTRWVEDEALMDVITAVSGSGPAYFFRFIEVLQAAAQQLGLDADNAAALVQRTALGAVRMVAESGEGAAELRRRVTSPGGTTERALSVLDQGGLDDLVLRALQGAAGRARELGTEMDR